MGKWFSRKVMANKIKQKQQSMFKISYPFNLSVLFMSKGWMGNPSEWHMKLPITISLPNKNVYNT